MNSWDLPNSGNGTAPTEGSRPPVRLLIVAQPSHAQAYHTAFAGDARFAVQAVATSAGDARAKLALEPEALLVEIVAFTGPDEFRDTLLTYKGLAWAITVPGLAPQHLDMIRQIPCVAQTIEGQPNLAQLAGEIYAAVLNRRSTGEVTGEYAELRTDTTMIGWRAIAVWSPQGGVGKSTIALALALEATARRLPALLVGLGAPDGMPLILDGIRPEPNILNWTRLPTVDGLRSAVQVHRPTGQHILVGFRDPVSVGNYEAQTGITSLTNLAYTAARAGYGIVVFDVSTQELAPAAISAANTLVMVARPDLPGIHAVLEGIHLVKDVIADQHAIPDAAIHLVLNRVRETTLRPEEVVRLGKRERRDFPPLAAYVTDDPGVETAVNQLKAAYYASDTLRGAAKTLGDLLFPAALTSQPQAAKPGRVVKLGPVRVRV